MDTLGALALATEPPTDHLMHRPPVGRRSEFSVGLSCWKAIFYFFILWLLFFFRGVDTQNDEASFIEYKYKAIVLSKQNHMKTIKLKFIIS